MRLKTKQITVTWLWKKYLQFCFRCGCCLFWRHSETTIILPILVLSISKYNKNKSTSKYRMHSTGVEDFFIFIRIRTSTPNTIYLPYTHSFYKKLLKRNLTLRSLKNKEIPVLGNYNNTLLQFSPTCQIRVTRSSEIN